MDLERLVLRDYALNGRRTTQRASIAFKRLSAGSLCLTPDRVSSSALDYAAKRMKEGAKPGTVNIELSMLRRALHLAHRHAGYPTKPDIPSLSVRNARQGFFERDQLDAVCALLPDWMADCARFAFLTGWRKGEIARLTWDQVDRANRIIRLGSLDTKNADPRTLPYAGVLQLETLIEARWEKTLAAEVEVRRKVSLVFHHKGESIYWRGRREWARACAKVGLGGRVFHDLRRSCVLNMERHRVPRSVAMKVTGHRSESIYRRYAIVPEGDVRQALITVSENGDKPKD